MTSTDAPTAGAAELAPAAAGATTAALLGVGTAAALVAAGAAAAAAVLVAAALEAAAALDDVALPEDFLLAQPATNSAAIPRETVALIAGAVARIAFFILDSRTWTLLLPTTAPDDVPFNTAGRRFAGDHVGGGCRPRRCGIFGGAAALYVDAEERESEHWPPRTTGIFGWLRRRGREFS